MRDQDDNSTTSYRWIASAVVLTVAIFALDVATGRGYAVGVLYVAPVLLGLWTRGLRTCQVLAVICPLLIILGYFLSAEDERTLLPISNRVYTFVIVSAAGVIALQRKSSRRELQRAHDELEDRVQRRTAELSEANALLEEEIEQRKLAEEELKRSNRELQQFAYVASHDLNEPLRTIKSYLQLISSRYEELLNSQGQEFIGVVKEGATRMQQLIGDLLEAAKIRSQGRPFAPVESSTAARRAIELLDAAIRDNDAKVEYDALPTVTADGRQLTQLFQNLIGNAIKYRGEAAPVIRLAGHEDSDEWLFSVRDNGIGIDPQHGKRIFEMFTRLHGRSEYSGTGIGLAICQRIVERHGGTIWVESEQDQGSTFFFTIPKQPLSLTANEMN